MYKWLVSTAVLVVIVTIFCADAAADNFERRHFIYGQNHHRSGLNTNVAYRHIRQPALQHRYSRPNSRIDPKRVFFTKRKIIYRYTNPIRVRKVSTVKSGRPVPSKFTPVTSDYLRSGMRYFYHTSGSSSRTKQSDYYWNNDHTFAGNRESRPSLIQSVRPVNKINSNIRLYPAAKTPAKNYKKQKPESSRNYNSDTHDSIYFKTKSIDRSYNSDQTKSILSGIVPPPGLRAVLIDKNGRTSINEIRSQNKPAMKQMQHYFPAGIGKRISYRSFPQKVLRFRVASIREARALLGDIGSGFKVTLINETNERLTIPHEISNPVTTTLASAVLVTLSRPTIGQTAFQSTAKKLTEALKHWWKGEHVCVKESPGLYGLSKKVWKKIETSKSCRENKRKYVCIERYGFGKRSPTKRTIFRCCAGYKISSNRQVCRPRSRRRIVLQPTLTSDVIRHMNPSKAVKTRLSSESENLTVFMPAENVVVAAFDSYGGFATKNGSMVRNFLENHVIPAKTLLSSQMENNQILTALSGNSIRINFYPSGSNNVMTVNCRKVTTPDVINDNTVIHFIGEIIENVNGSIFNYLQKNSQKFSNFLSVLNETKLMKDLRQTNGSYTLFAPTNSAFGRLSSNKEACADSFVRNHVIDDVICSAFFKNGKIIGATLHGEKKFAYNFHDRIYVDEAQVISRDIVTSNGVIHVIDRVIKPSSVFTILDVIKSTGQFSIALSLFQAANITNAFATRRNFSVIIPHNMAFKEISRRWLRLLRESEERLRSWLMFHLLPVRLTLDDFVSNAVVETLNPPLSIHASTYSMKVRSSTAPGRRRYFRKAVTALQCALILKQPRVLPCNGAIFVVKKFLKPPSGSVLTTMMYSMKSDFSTLLLAIRRAGLERILDGDNVITMFAPNDAAFARIPQQVVKRLMRNKQKLVKVLKFHIVSGFHCRHQLQQRPSRHATLQRSSFFIFPKKKKVYLGAEKGRLRSRIVKSDFIGTNGIIHVIDHLLLPRNLRVL